MTFVIELDEGTAARRRVPFKLFTSDGTSPDTGASGDSVMYSVNGGAQSDLTASVISANAGMYYAEFAAADVGTLGTIAMWHDVGSFEQHVANINVVNYNPMSTQSDLLLTDLSIGTVSHLDNQSVGTVDHGLPSAATIAGVTNTLTVVNALNDIDGSGVTVHAGGIASTAFAASAIDAAAIATDAVNEIADGFLDRDMTTGTDSGTSAIRTPRNALRALRNRVESDTTQVYVYGENDTTIEWTASISTAESTDPHISGMDPNS